MDRHLTSPAIQPCSFDERIKSLEHIRFQKITFATFKRYLHELDIGKRVNHSVYMHIECLNLLREELNFLIGHLMKVHNISTEYNVIKLFESEFKISFLAYPDFFDAPHPTLKSSVTVDLLKGKIRTFDYAKNENPPILHRKELMLPSKHSKIDEFSYLTNEEEAKGLYQNLYFIGFKKNWEALLDEKGLSYDGHKLIRKHVAKTVVEDHSVQIHRHKTAITRYDFSRPIKKLVEHGLLTKTNTLLDYGCGQGDDIGGLKKMGFSVSGWDPVFYPNENKSPADIVNLGFVLNVIEDPLERTKTLKEAYALSNKLLVVSTLSANTGIPESGRPYKDGILTCKNTFQRYYFQDELQQLIEDSLDTAAIAVGLGIFYVFRSPLDHQEFLANRTKRAINWLDLSYKLFPSAREQRKSRLETLYDTNKDIFDSFWSKMLELGRLPDHTEFDQYLSLMQLVGSVKKAKNLYLNKFGSDILIRAAESRRKDLLVYLALSNFRKLVPFRHLPQSLKLDIKSFFGTYQHAITEGRGMLFKAGDPIVITELCNNTKCGVLDEQALYIHKTLVQELHPVLRIYIGCAEILFGDLSIADIIKIHKRSGKVTLLRYSGFDAEAIPRLLERIKINLQKQLIFVYDHSRDNRPSLLYNKESFKNCSRSILN